MGTVVCAVALSAFSGALPAGEKPGVKASVETDNFVIRSYELGLARRVARDIERKRGEISRALGVSEIKPWSPRCGIFIYEHKSAYMRGADSTPWSSGWSKIKSVTETTDKGDRVDKVTRSIHTFEKDSHEQLMSVISHELAHVVFRDAVRPSATIPLWLDEGVANFIQEDGLEDYRKVAKRMAKRGKSIPLPDLFHAKGYPDDRMLFYAESASVVDMMIDTFGNVPFLIFARLVTEGIDPSRALNDAYGTFTGNIDTFEERWKKYVMDRY